MDERIDYLVLTKDTDFLRMPADEYAGVLFDPHGQLSAYTIASIILAIAEQYDRDDLRGVTHATEGWL